jgi:Dolichyl-phosphate-mannose-protein mannosyltransferase
MHRGPDNSGSMTASAADRLNPEHALQLGWLDTLVRYRRLIYTLVALLYVASFNGIWRVNVDSALYRGLARSLARGDGYVFAGEHHQHAYAGLPWLLAGIETLFGSSPVPGIILITLMALATLWLVDRLIAIRFPLWVATLCTLGLGLNFRFLRLSQELMTDVPFTLGVMASLYGLARLRHLAPGQHVPLLRAGIILVLGMLLAAATRPTFGVLAVAIVLGSVVRLFQNRDGKRWLHASLVVAALLVLVALFAVDPRTERLNPLGGVYEQELVERVQELPRTFVAQLDGFLGRNLNDAFFSQHMSPFAVPIALVLLAGSVLVLRRDVVWGLLVLGIILVTLPLSTVPRYYLMVMPLLWLGWIAIVSHLAIRSPARFRGPIAFIALLTPLVLNLGRGIGFIIEQRQPDVAALFHGQDRETAFYARYRDGVVIPQIAWSKMIAEHASPDQLVVGPVAHVLAYYSDRRVLGGRSLFGAKDVPASRLPNQIAKVAPDFAIFPHGVYGENDAQLRDLIRKRVLVPLQVVAEASEASLCTVVVRLPPPGVNWKTYRPPDPASRPTTADGRRLTAQEKADLLAKRQRKLEKEERERREAKRAKQEKLERQLRKERQLKNEIKEKRERKERRERLERRQRQAERAASQPTTVPTTLPVILPTTFPRTPPTSLPIPRPDAVAPARAAPPAR